MTLLEFADKHPVWTLCYLLIICATIPASIPRITVRRRAEERTESGAKKTSSSTRAGSN